MGMYLMYVLHLFWIRFPFHETVRNSSSALASRWAASTVHFRLDQKLNSGSATLSGSNHHPFKVWLKIQMRFHSSPKLNPESVPGDLEVPQKLFLSDQLEQHPEWETGCIARFIIANRVFLQGCIQCVVTNMPRNSQVFFRGGKKTPVRPYLLTQHFFARE